MKTTYKQNPLAATLVGALASSGLTTQALAEESGYDKVANAPFQPWSAEPFATVELFGTSK